MREFKHERLQLQRKRHLQNKHLGNDDHFVTSYLHALLLTEHGTNHGLIEAPLK